MSQTIVRLQGLELRNIKNVEFGKIEMPNSYQNERRYNKAKNIKRLHDINRRNKPFKVHGK